MSGTPIDKESEQVVGHAVDFIETGSAGTKGCRFCPVHPDTWIAKPKKLIGYERRSCPECDQLHSQSLVSGDLHGPSASTKDDADHADDADFDFISIREQLYDEMDLMPEEYRRATSIAPIASSAKVVMFGDDLSGKTALYSPPGVDDDTSSQATGTSFAPKKVVVGSEVVTLNIWDSMGQERFRSIAPLYLRNARAAIFCFNVTDTDSLRRLQVRVDDVRRQCGEGKVVMAIVGNKNDLISRREVTQEDGEAFAAKCGGKYFEISAETGSGVDAVLQHVAEELVRRSTIFHSQEHRKFMDMDIPLTGAALKFEINDSASLAVEALLHPYLAARLSFQGATVEGHHSGARCVAQGETSFWSLWADRFTVQAHGEGEFIAPQLTYRGAFVNGKFHDLTGNACLTCDKYKYIGDFEDGHCSGPGALQVVSADGKMRIVFRGVWKLSKPWVGCHFDESGDEVTIYDGEIMGWRRPLSVTQGEDSPQPLP